MDLGLEFALDEGFIHLNHAAVAPWPRRTVEAVKAFAEENSRRGSLAYPQWVETETALREQFRALINAESGDDVALVKNTSEALSFVAYGLDWRAGDSVVITDQEFPSNRIVWESLARRGVTTRKAPLAGGETPEDAIFDAVDETTRLIAVSSVQYATGLRMDLARIGRFCRQHDILFCVDAIQGLGALPMDVAAIQADFVAADGHKWMLGPEGLGLFYCRPELRERLELTQYGWHMVAQLGDYDRQAWEPTPTARRFEPGSPNMLGVQALHASLSLLLEYGIANVETEIKARVAYLAERLASCREVELLSDLDPGRRSGILTFRRRDLTDGELFERLSERGVFCARRGGGVRLSPHFYTPYSALDAVIDAAISR